MKVKKVYVRNYNQSQTILIPRQLQFFFNVARRITITWEWSGDEASPKPKATSQAHLHVYNIAKGGAPYVLQMYHRLGKFHY